MMALLLLFDGLHPRSTSHGIKMSMSFASKSNNVYTVVAVAWSNLHLRSTSSLSCGNTRSFVSAASP